MRRRQRPLARSPLFHLFFSFFLCATIDDMNPYSGTSTLAKVLRAAALGGGLVYGSVKLGYLKVRRFVPSNEGTSGTGGSTLPSPGRIGGGGVPTVHSVP